MGHHDVDAVADHIDDVLGGVLHQLELLLRRVAQGVAAQGDDDTWAVSFLIWHKTLSNLDYGIQQGRPHFAISKARTPLNCEYFNIECCFIQRQNYFTSAGSAFASSFEFGNPPMPRFTRSSFPST